MSFLRSRRLGTAKRKIDGEDETAEEFLTRFSVDHKKVRTVFFQLTEHQIRSDSEIISAKEFKAQMMRSLKLLKIKAPKYYGLFCLYNVPVILTDDLDNAFAQASIKKNCIEFSSAVLNTMGAEVCDEFVAATLIHEVIHIWQHQAALPHFESSRQCQELVAYEHEIEVLRIFGADETFLDLLRRERGTHNEMPQYYNRSVTRRR